MTNSNDPQKIKDLLKIEESTPVEKEDRTVWILPDGRIHRKFGPAIETKSGTQCWYNYNEIHREDGPAVVTASGTQQWYINGKLHREDGPAVIHAYGGNEYWVEGNQLSFSEYIRHVKNKARPTES